MRIGIVGAHLRGFSGIPTNLIAAMRSHAEVIEHTLPDPRPRLGKRIVMRSRRALTGRAYLWDKDPERCAMQSRALDAFAASANVDAILLFGSEACAFSETTVPLFGFGDSVFGSRVDLYDDQRFPHVSAQSVREGFEVQQRALRKMRRFFITSRWAWERAQQVFGYDVPDEKIEVTLIGANLPHLASVPPSQPALRLLWVGVDWKRKRGDFAIAIVAVLRARGFDARLDIAGAKPPSPPPEWVTVHGSLSASTGLGDRYASAAALLLPTIADLTPIVIAEAAMYGRPAIATPIGGIPEMVDASSGILIDSDDPVIWADRIATAHESGRLPLLGASARTRYESSFRWDLITRRIADRIEETSS